MKQYELYFFDFDGTLFDSYKSLVHVYDEAFRTIGQSSDEKDARVFMHMSLEETLRVRGVTDPKERKTFLAGIAKAIDDPKYVALTAIYPDVREVLAELKKRGRGIGLVSGNSPIHIALVLKEYGLSGYFTAVVGSSDLYRPKPFADPILHGLKSFPDTEKKDAVYIGDSLQDPETAFNAGVDGILLDRNNEYISYEKKKIRTLRELLL